MWLHTLFQTPEARIVLLETNIDATTALVGPMANDEDIIHGHQKLTGVAKVALTDSEVTYPIYSTTKNRTTYLVKKIEFPRSCQHPRT
jgi:hypothetical protein